MPKSSAKPPPGRIDREAVAALAAHGLTEAEIRLKLSLPTRLSASQAAVLAAGIREGRLRGSAEIKEAQYQAAMKGQVSAQGRVLEFLKDDDGEIEVVREIYGSEDEEA